MGGSAGAAGAATVSDCPPDEDLDDIPDDLEGKATNRDTDIDGVPDYLDTDSDNDTLPDKLERGDPLSVGCTLVPDADGDGQPNPCDSDSDGNGLHDEDEPYATGGVYDPTRPLTDVDGDGTPDVFDQDDDGDGLDDVDELVNGAGVDTDGDGYPDHADADADGDTIADRYETTADFDGDGTPNFRDLDSDKDGIPDKCEAGFAHQVAAPPANTDNDNHYDAYDHDSDNDWIKDGEEDVNFDCVVETGETDRTKADTDGDGVGDMIEIWLGSDPACASCTPESMGTYYFVQQFFLAPQPAFHDVVVRTNLNKGDIAFIVDGTSSMAGALTSLRQDLSSVVTQLKADLPDAHFGVLTAEEYPVAPYGSATNLPVRLPSSTAYLSGSAADFQTAIDSIALSDGGDAADAQLVAMYRALDDSALPWPGGAGGGLIAPYSPPGGGFGGLGFRPDALPVLVLLTDSAFHNGRFVGQTTLHDPYTFAGGSPTVDAVIGSMNLVGAKFVGVALDGGGSARQSGDPYRDMATIADATKSYVLPGDAFGSAQCLVDVGAGPLSPDGPGVAPSCRLIFSTAADGTGASNSVVDGVKALLRGLTLEVRVVAQDGASQASISCGGQLYNAVDDFIDSIEVNITGGVEDPTEPGKYCEALDINYVRDWYGCGSPAPGCNGPRGEGGPPPLDNPDGINETVVGVTSAPRICFRITPKMNTYCPQSSVPQLVRATLIVYARNPGQNQELQVGLPRDVVFIIPPISA